MARAAGDLADVAARLGAALRAAGLPAGPGRCERFAAAVLLARPATVHALYQCALATLVSDREHIGVLAAVFGEMFGSLGDPDGPGDLAAAPVPDGPQPAADLLAQAVQAARQHAAGPQGTVQPDDGDPDAPDPARQVEDRYLGSAAERLAGTDFADLTDAELALLAGMMRQLTLAVPARRSRRQRRRPGGPRTDMRATLRQARRTGGHAFRLISRAPAPRPRRLVVLCDISGSMEPYARAMIQLLYCAADGAQAEVFSFATRLTRLTPALARSRPDLVLRRAAQAAPDWHGGTRIGAALKEFNDSCGRRGMARGAVIMIISDGWDTGPPEVVRREMERLSLVAYRIVWVNPRAKSAAYQPLAGGMAAAWPHCDAVISAHTLHAIGQLTAALADPVRRRAPVSPGRRPAPGTAAQHAGGPSSLPGPPDPGACSRSGSGPSPG